MPAKFNNYSKKQHFTFYRGPGVESPEFLVKYLENLPATTRKNDKPINLIRILIGVNSNDFSFFVYCFDWKRAGMLFII